MWRKKGVFWLGLAGLLITRLALAWSPADQHDIGLMEQRLFQQVYDREAPVVRVGRLEQSVYGVSKTGTPESRLSALRKALPALPPAAAITTGKSEPATASAPAQAAKPPEKAVGESDYPVVDDMERRVLNQVYPKEDLSVRVPRLEARVFGRPGQGDWSTRVDALRDRVLGPAATAAVPAGDAIDTGEPGFHVAPDQVAPALTQMERQLFKQTYDNEAVTSRLNRLETKLFNKTAPSELSPEERVERIIAVAGAGGERPAQTRSPAANIAIQLAPLLIMMLPLVI